MALTLDLYDVPNTSTAEFSPCRTYRYHLARRWALGPRVNFIMLNPSTADALANDPTIRKCVKFAKRWGYGGLDVTNLFAFRSASPAVMKRASDPVGPENNEWITRFARECEAVVCAWGTNGAYMDRGDIVCDLLLGVDLQCLSVTDDGCPGHPLYLPDDSYPFSMDRRFGRLGNWRRSRR